MFVDDHDRLTGGRDNTVTVRLSPAELKKLGRERLIEGQNQSGNKITVVLMVEDRPRATSAS